MTGSSAQSVTQLLSAWSQGDTRAGEELIRQVYPELRRLAALCFRRERSEHTLQVTALVNEAYLRLVDQRASGWQSRAHFFAMAARVMRHVLVDHARRRLRAKRGGELLVFSFDETFDLPIERAQDLVAVDDALAGLETIDAEQARIVEMRFFSGLSVEEIAEVQGVSAATVHRRWRLARAWLFRALKQGEEHQLAGLATD